MPATEPADTAVDAPLPELTQALLDAPTLAQLFTDLATCTRVLEVSVKFDLREMTPAARPTLDEARSLLAAGHARAVQIRYAYDGAEWCDTLIATPAGTRIVRMQTPS